MALVPLLVAISRGTRPDTRRAFLLGLIAGLVCFAGTIYWTSEVVRHYGGLNLPVAVFVAGLLVACLALFPALFALALASLIRGVGRSALMLAPLIWVTTELGREHEYLFGGFPWVLLGYSQTTVLPVAQLASVAGVYGISALLVLVNATIAYAVTVERPLRPYGWFLKDSGRGPALAIAATVAIVAAVLGGGNWRLGKNDLVRAGQPLRVGLVQGNVAQDDKWDPALAEEIVTRYVSMTREAAARGARVIIWPESATPFFFDEDPGRAAAIRAVARETGTYLLVGSDQLERSEARGIKYYVAAFLLRPDGETAAVYRKIHLVPFGEYVPLKRLLFFVAPLVEAVSDFSPGTSAILLPIGDDRVSTAICYEIVYPSLMRQFVRQGAQLLTTITNDAWYGRSSAPYQHFEQAAMRAIEHGRYLARAANTGVSGLVDPYGRVLARSEIFEPAVIVGDARLLETSTIYDRIGYVFVYVCALVTAVALVAVRVRVKR